MCLRCAVACGTWPDACVRELQKKPARGGQSCSRSYASETFRGCRQGRMTCGALGPLKTGRDDLTQGWPLAHPFGGGGSSWAVVVRVSSPSAGPSRSFTLTGSAQQIVARRTVRDRLCPGAQFDRLARKAFFKICNRLQRLFHRLQLETEPRERQH